MVEIYVMNVENSLKTKCWFSALALSLALPDICGAAEFPDETSTAKRYIEWYDKYLGEYMASGDNTPFLSGEVVFNLRNTFLHSGSPNIDSSKVKQETNQLDKFVLFVGDGTLMWSLSGVIACPIASYRIMMVDVTYLCRTICAASLRYYQENRDKFHFDFFVETQEEFISRAQDPTKHVPIEIALQMYRNSITKVLNKKLEQMGETVRIDGTADGATTIRVYKTAGEDESLQETQTIVPATAEKKQPKTSAKKKQPEPDTREAEVRAFVDAHFKGKEYTEQKKEQIMQAILQAETKQQVNNALQRSFPSEESGVIYKRISPLIASLPGR